MLCYVSTSPLKIRLEIFVEEKVNVAFLLTHLPPLRHHLEVVSVIHSSLREQPKEVVKILLASVLVKGESHRVKEKGHHCVFRVSRLN